MLGLDAFVLLGPVGHQALRQPGNRLREADEANGQQQIEHEMKIDDHPAGVRVEMRQQVFDMAKQ